MKAGAAAIADSNIAFARRSDMLLSAALLGVLVVLLVPLPTVLLDMLIAINLALAILLLLVTLSVTRPLDISAFPSLLLLLTLYRIALNVASTRLILLDGDAGRIVETFGGFVVGGNLIVGLVIFLILVIVQFIVITKGAGRVSEVAARFTLDALPGKQMAIDAELNAGAIDDKQARARRSELTREAEFYGAMDGASKFVRGDAIAGLVIIAVNIVGGIVVGAMQGMPLMEALRRYATLTVGDGLVSQIPALIVAITAGLLITKSDSKTSLGQEIGGQVLSRHRPLMAAAVILSITALTPGLPKIPFFLLAGGLVLAAKRVEKETKPQPAPPPTETGSASAPPEEQVLDEFLQTDRACVEIGSRLVPLMDGTQSKGLAARIATLRRDLTKKHGLWVPAIRLRSNFQLGQDVYRVLIGGREVARGELRPGRLLAIDPGGARGELEGEKAADPAFGLAARWIEPDLRRRAELGGYTVVDAASVLITHLGELLRKYAHELLSREDLKKLLDKLKDSAPTVVDELRPEVLRTSTLHQVLVLLLQERVSVTDLPRILEVLLHHGPQIKDPVALAERVRESLGRSICDRFRDEAGKVRVIVLEPRLEALLRDALHEGNLSLTPQQLERLLAAVSRQHRQDALAGLESALLTDGMLRRAVRRSLERALPEAAVMAYTEIPNDLLIEPVTMLRLDEIHPAERA